MHWAVITMYGICWLSALDSYTTYIVIKINVLGSLQKYVLLMLV